MVDIIHRLWGNVYDTEEVKDQKLKIKMTDSTVIARSPSAEGRRGDLGPLPCHSEGALRLCHSEGAAQDKLRDRRISVVGGNAVHSSTSSE